jgi:hypothetical protein
MTGLPAGAIPRKMPCMAPDVPAVEEFRKLIEEVEKQQKSKP